MANSKSRRHRNRVVLAPESLEQRRVLTTLAGTVYEDVDNDTALDELEPRLSGVVVYLDANNNGVLDQRGYGLDPDEFEPGQVLNNARQSVFSSGTASDNQPAFRVLAVDSPTRATTGQRIFGLQDTTDWGIDRRLRFDFTLPVDSVSLDVVGSSGLSNPNVRLDAYNATGNLIASQSVNSLGNGILKNLEIVRDQKDISFAVAHVTTAVGTAKFDNLRADDAGSERATVTSDTGFYQFANVDAGLAIVTQQPTEGYDLTSPAEPYRINVVNGSVRSTLNFGNRTGSIGGVVFEELGATSDYEPGTDRAIEGAGVYLDSNQNGSPDTNDATIEPDEFLDNQSLDFVSDLVSLSTVDADGQSVDLKVLAAVDAVASPTTKVFTHEGVAAWTSQQRFRADFASLSDRVKLQFLGGATLAEQGTLIAYSATGEELASLETAGLGLGETQSLEIIREGFDIKYVVAYTSTPSGGTDGSIRLSDLESRVVKEPVAITDEFGEYEFKPLASGSYQVRAIPSSAFDPSFPVNQVQLVSVTVGQAQDEVDFGFEPDTLPPVAKNDFIRTQEDFVVSIGVLINDSDPDGELDIDSVTLTQLPTNGVAEVDASGFINYTPNPNFHGRDTLLYTVRDDEGAVSNTAIVTIQVDSVNDPPVAVDDAVAALALNPTSFNVLQNDSDIDGTVVPATVKIIDSPSAGTAEVDPVTGVITYTPRATIAGIDTITYTVEDNDGAESNEATVTITRRDTGSPPVAVGDFATTLEGTATQILLTSNDTDADGTIDLGSVFVVTPPTNGAVTVDGGGSVTYQPNLGFLGADTFAYRVHDNDGLVSNSATVSVSMTERDFPYQNPINSLDVDGDGNVSPRDVLFIIKEIDDREVSDPTTGAITINPTPGTRPAGYFDVDGNGFVIGRDVLAVIQHINQAGEANGEPADDELVNTSDVDAVAAVFAAFDALDPAEDEDEFLPLGR